MWSFWTIKSPAAVRTCVGSVGHSQPAITRQSRQTRMSTRPHHTPGGGFVRGVSQKGRPATKKEVARQV